MDLTEADRLRLLEAGRKLLEDRRRAAPKSTNGAAPASVAATSGSPLTGPAALTLVPAALALSSDDDETSKLRAKTAAQLKRIDQLMAEKADLVSRVDQLERNTLEICAENNAQRSRFEDAVSKCHKLEEENANLRAELQAPPSVDELAALRKELEEKTTATRDLQRRLAQSETTLTQRARTMDSLEEDVRAERAAHSATVRSLEEKLAAAIKAAAAAPSAPASTLTSPHDQTDFNALKHELTETKARVETLTQERDQMQAVAERTKQLEAQLERAHNEKQILSRTHQLELQHAEEARARELQTRLTTATSSVQTTLANLQASNATLLTANAQLEQQLRERMQELASVKTKEMLVSREAQGSREHLAAEVGVLKKELAQAKQTAEESLSLAQELQATLESLLQNGVAQEENTALLQARIVKMELAREELRAAQVAEAQRVREAVAEATAASEKPSTLEELQEQKIVQLLAQIGALEGLLRERTEAITKLSDQQFELAHELEKSKKASGRYWSDQQDVNTQVEAAQSANRHLLKELNEIRTELRADSRRAVLVPELLARLDSLAASEGKPPVARSAPSLASPQIASSPVTGQAPASTPVLASPPVLVSATAPPMNGSSEKSKTKKHNEQEDHNDHDGHGHAHDHEGHGHAHDGAHGHSHERSHGHAHEKQPKRGGIRGWLFGPRQAPAAK